MGGAWRQTTNVWTLRHVVPMRSGCTRFAAGRTLAIRRRLSDGAWGVAQNPDVMAVGGTADRQALLPPELRVLHQRVLLHFLESGGPPSAAEGAGLAAELGLEPRAALDALRDADLVHVAGGRVSVAYPFSGVPTAHVVRLVGYEPVYAMCGVDALGMIPMTDVVAGVIESVDADTGQAIVVSYRDGLWQFAPAETVLLVAATGTGDASCRSTCPYINFHVSVASAEAFLAANDRLAGAILKQGDAIALGDRLFGPLLR